MGCYGRISQPTKETIKLKDMKTDIKDIMLFLELNHVRKDTPLTGNACASLMVKYVLEKKQFTESQPVMTLPSDEDNPWPTVDVLTKLIEATEYLLHHNNYDGQWHEEYQLCVKRGKEIIVKAQTQRTEITEDRKSVV